MKIPVIDLGSQWSHRIWRTLKYLKVETELIPVTTNVDSLKDVDAIVLSGGAIRISQGDDDQTGNVRQFLDELQVPILGICAGQQLMGLHFGGKARASANPEYGKVQLEIEDKNDLFEGLPDSFVVWASHNDEVVDVPHFKILAKSKDCSNHAMKHEKKPFYGLLFHPEVEHSEYGSEIYKNFLGVCKR